MKNVPAGSPVRLAPRLILVLGGLLAGVILARLVQERPQPPGGAGEGTVPSAFASAPAASAEEFKLGQNLSKQWCASCHLLPEPALLDKVNWGLEILPAMGDWMGIRDYPYEQVEMHPRVREAGKIPKDPQMSLEEWRSICRFYLETAPNEVPLLTNRPPIRIGLRHFELFMPPKGALTAHTTLISVDSSSRQIFLGNTTNELVVLDPLARELASTKLPGPPVAIDPRADGYYVTVIGSYLPSDALQGKVVFVARPGAPESLNRVVLDELPRPVDTHFADFNGDGREDILVCGYGNILGELAWYETKGADKPVKHVIQDRPGAIKAYVHDFNRDGRPDIVVMFAQARESIELLLNQGGGVFDRQVIVEKHPAWGYAHLELADVNGDGAMDLLASNGDNGDHINHIPPYKPYHGIHLYLNDGRNSFSETWFHPLNGAYKTVTRDFDLDGDLDIAAISFYPDYRRHPREGFIYLENKGGWSFETFSFEESLRGRWLTMDAGDLDGDGDLDIVLGAFVDGPTHVPGALHEKWRELTPPLFILRNTIRR